MADFCAECGAAASGDVDYALKTSHQVDKMAHELEKKAGYWDALLLALKTCGFMAMKYDKELKQYEVTCGPDLVPYLLEEPLEELQDCIEHHADYCGDYSQQLGG